jgi:hypothetical protein
MSSFAIPERYVDKGMLMQDLKPTKSTTRDIENVRMVNILRNDPNWSPPQSDSSLHRNEIMQRSPICLAIKIDRSKYDRAMA